MSHLSSAELREDLKRQIVPGTLLDRTRYGPKIW